MSARDLIRLARLHGIQTTYRDGLGNRRRASAATLEGVLRGLDVDTGDPAASLRVGVRELWSELSEPVCVAWGGRGALLVRAPETARDQVRIEVASEDGSTLRRSTELAEAPIIERFEDRGRVLASRLVPLPAGLAPGYHRATVRLGHRSAAALVISAPQRAPTPEPGTRAFGAVAPLYSLRSHHDHGIADLGDLARLLAWAHEHGGTFVGTLPLLSNFLDPPAEISPYLPASRLAWNELYLELPATPAWSRAPEAQAALDSTDNRAERRRLGRARLADPAAAYALKRPAIEALARALFSIPSRRAELERFAAGRPEIVEYARFRAATEQLGRSWRDWPGAARAGRLRDGDVAPDAFRTHLYAQFAMHEQLADLSQEARSRGPGLYLDLPVGAHGGGFDPWYARDAFAAALGIGAPPDRLFEGGQSWGLPSPHPDRLRRTGYRHYIDVLRNHLRYAGVLRLDHVMGVERLFVIPAGAEARDGTYVRFRAEELWAILTLEAARAGALLVGEDLGTVPRSVRAAMRRRGVSRMHVLEFAVNPTASPALERPPANALATISTHDLPPFAGWEAGRDIDVRTRLGSMTGRRAASARTTRRSAVRSLRRSLGVPPRASTHELLLSALRHLGESDAPLVAVSLDDLAGASEAQNVPGTVDEHPNWRRRTETARDTLQRPALLEAVQALSDARTRAGLNPADDGP